MLGDLCGLGLTYSDFDNEGGVGLLFDDSIVQDTTAEKKQDMAEVAAGLKETWEYRAK